MTLWDHDNDSNNLDLKRVISLASEYPRLSCVIWGIDDDDDVDEDDENW